MVLQVTSCVPQGFADFTQELPWGIAKPQRWINFIFSDSQTMPVDSDGQFSEVIQELQDALEGLDTGDVSPLFVEGHGVQSRVFQFSWSDEQLQIDIRLPYLRLLSSEEDQEEQQAEIGAAIRMAMLVLKAAEVGKLLADGEADIHIACTASGVSYVVFDEAGQVVEEDEDWALLTSRLEAAFADDEDAFVIITP